MGNNVTVEESFENLNSFWTNLCEQASYCSPFLLPAWMETWWGVFGGDARLNIWVVRQNDTVIGIAPVQLILDTAALIGRSDTCDYQDFLIVPGKEQDFFSLLLPEMTRAGIQYLDFPSVKADSHVINTLVEIARSVGLQVSCRSNHISLEIDLPSTWDDYLGMLNKKQRHEIKRKLRRLHEAGSVNFYIVKNEKLGLQHMDLFFALFRQSRDDKSNFMTSQMESFFRKMSISLAKIDVLKLGILELNSIPVAAVIGFDYQGTVYLYNSGYNPQYSYLSIGLLSKVMFIQESLQRSRKKFDLLSGAEEYKYRLGGKEVALHSCRITLA